MAQRRGSRPLAQRRIELGEAFRPTLDRLEITHDASARKAVGQVVGRLDREVLPGQRDVLVRIVVMPTGVGTAWARRVAGRSLWVLYRFDAHIVKILAVTNRKPVRVEPD